MPFTIIRDDLSRVHADAIINAASRDLMGGSGADQALHDAGGPDFEKACRLAGHCEPGQSVITRGGLLPCKYVIHTVGPRWKGGDDGEEELLRSCYRTAFDAAAKLRCKTVAFPLMGSGSRSFPKDLALDIATQEMNRFLDKHSIFLILVIYDRETMLVTKDRKLEIEDYLNRKYRSANDDDELPEEFRPLSYALSKQMSLRDEMCFSSDAESSVKECSACMMRPAWSIRPKAKKDLSTRLRDMDASFSETLCSLITQKGLTNKECYDRVFMDRKLFSKIITKKDGYHPSKGTTIALAIALRLNLSETESFIQKAGYALTDASKADVIVKYFIEQEEYNIITINETLFEYDQPLLLDC